MKINERDFPPISIFGRKKLNLHLPPELGYDYSDSGGVQRFLNPLVSECRKNIFTVSRSIEDMIGPNRERLMDAFLKDPDEDMFSGAFIDTSMEVPSIELYKFLPSRRMKWIDETEEDVFTYLFASIQGVSCGELYLVALGVIEFVYNREGLFSNTQVRCRPDDVGNSIRYMKFLLELNVFLRYADTETIKVYGQQKRYVPDGKDYIDNRSGIMVKYIDSRWLREIIRTEGFKVRGHFRLQPFKDEDGGWDRKLIYINEYEKHGYHRRALRDLEENE